MLQLNHPPDVSYVASYCPVTGVLEEVDDAGAVLYLPATNQTFILNRVGVIIWKAITRGVNMEQLLNVVRGEFPSVSIECLTSDVSGFLSAMEKVGLIERKVLSRERC
jgi:hypothetical protein